MVESFGRWPLAALLLLAGSWPAPAADLPPGFLRLADIAPTIRQDIRYAGMANFLGRPAKGYRAAACILTEKAARALAAAQKKLAAERLTLVVFDCYRPARAVEDFVRWVEHGGPPDLQWHPKVKRGDLIAEGYIAERSTHSRGSAVDLAIAPAAEADAAADPACGARGANTLEFGTGFDCFDPASGTAWSPLPSGAAGNRKRLVEVMREAGFKNYSREWWHFTLEKEPYPKTRFDFPVTAN